MPPFSTEMMIYQPKKPSPSIKYSCKSEIKNVNPNLWVTLALFPPTVLYSLVKLQFLFCEFVVDSLHGQFEFIHLVPEGVSLLAEALKGLLLLKQPVSCRVNLDIKTNNLQWKRWRERGRDGERGREKVGREGQVDGKRESVREGGRR